MDDIVVKKAKNIKNMYNELCVLFEKVKMLFLKDYTVYAVKIEEGLKHLIGVHDRILDIKPVEILDLALIYTDFMNSNILIDIINDIFVKVLDKKVNVETFLSQTYVNETRAYNEKIQVLFAKYKSASQEYDAELLKTVSEQVVASILSEEKEVVSRFEQLCEFMMRKFVGLNLVETVANILIDKTHTDTQLSHRFIKIIDKHKNQIFPDAQLSHKFKSDNVYFNNFGLTAVSSMLSERDIANLLFKDAGKLSIKEICKRNNYDLVIIKKILDRGIQYNILNLLDYEESGKYEMKQSVDDGVSHYTIERNKTINYISDNFKKWQIEYDYVHKSNKNGFVLILQQIHDDAFVVLSNRLSRGAKKYFLRKDAIFTLLSFIENKGTYNQTRVGSYNKIVNRGIVQNMFLPIKANVDDLKVKSQIVDPKYIRNEIYIAILSKFNALLSKKKIKNLYEFSKLVHDESYENTFKQLVMNEYSRFLFKNNSIYEAENISVSEIFASFLPVMNIYERDFKKKMHDVFLSKIPTKEIFDTDDSEFKLKEVFDDLLKTVLNIVITNESNIFQTIIYKLLLFKLSILD